MDEEKAAEVVESLRAERDELAADLRSTTATAFRSQSMTHARPERRSR